MNELLGIDANIPIFHLIPFVVFGPIFFMVLYHLGLKSILRPSPELKERIRLRKAAEKHAADERRDKMRSAGLGRRSLKRSPAQWLGQGLTYALFAGAIAVLSSWPPYDAAPKGSAEVRLSMTHPGQRKAECHKRTAEELRRLAANMRAPMECTRERWPLVVEMTLDGEPVFRGTARPAGLSKDGHSSFYEKFRVPAGRHLVRVGLSDRGGEGAEGFDYEMVREMELAPGEVLVVGFDNAAGGLKFE